MASMILLYGFNDNYLGMHTLGSMITFSISDHDRMRVPVHQRSSKILYQPNDPSLHDNMIMNIKRSSMIGYMLLELMADCDNYVLPAINYIIPAIALIVAYHCAGYIIANTYLRYQLYIYDRIYIELYIINRYSTLYLPHSYCVSLCIILHHWSNFINEWNDTKPITEVQTFVGRHHERKICEYTCLSFCNCLKTQSRIH